MAAEVTLIRISAPHFVAAVVVGQRAAPIVGYMKRWDRDMIVAYCSRRGWAVEEAVADAAPPRQARLL